MITPVDASYLADAVILMRYFETKGEVRQAISVIKKRGGAHERTIREFQMANGRIRVGEPLRDFRGDSYRGTDIRRSAGYATWSEDCVTEGGRERLEQRVLVLAPTSKDAHLTRSVLERAGVICVCCSTLDQVTEELEAGAGAVLLAEEAVSPETKSSLTKWVAGQPPWSDLPVVILARVGADSASVAQAMDLLGNVTVLERPMRVAALISAVQTSLRARRQQYQAREHIVERERAEAELRVNDRRKDEFLAMLAHELRNPLAPIRNAAEILSLISEEPARVRETERNHRPTSPAHDRDRG